MRIEEFSASHANELIELWRESFEFGVGVKDPHPIEEHTQFLLTQVVPNNAVRVAFLEDRMVGFIAATPTSVSQLFVRVGFHRQGIGSQLLDWAKGQSSGSLWLYTFERNAMAQAFYERHGFSIAARGHEPFWDLDDIRYEWKDGKN